MKQAKDNKAVPEIVIPKGYSIDEMLEEVKIHFER